ncbi:MAG: hypothetical protein P4L33_04295 [Capsulimonadaceae bacterium]|nr:hypothetical protein [Capsulimonadaceae bacterium]
MLEQASPTVESAKMLFDELEHTDAGDGDEAIHIFMTAIERHVSFSRKADWQGLSINDPDAVELMHRINTAIDGVRSGHSLTKAFPVGSTEYKEGETECGNAYFELEHTLPAWFDRLVGIPGAFLIPQWIDLITGGLQGAPYPFDYEESRQIETNIPYSPKSR